MRIYPQKNNEKVEVKGYEIGTPVDIENRSAIFEISNSVMDDDNEVIKVEGMDITSVMSGKRNVSWIGHNHEREAALIEDISRSDGKIIAKIKYPERPTEYPEQEAWDPDIAYCKAKVGFHKASIDYISLDRRKPTKQDIELYGENVELVHTKTKLVGFSVTSLPANEDAQLLAIKALKENKIDKDELKLLDIDIEEQNFSTGEKLQKDLEEELKEEKGGEEEKKVEGKPITAPREEELEELEKTQEELEKEAQEIYKKVKSKRSVKRYIKRYQSPDIVRKQITDEVKRRLARKQGKVFLD